MKFITRLVAAVLVVLGAFLTPQQVNAVIGWPISNTRTSPPCRDTNGSAPGGSFYWSYYSGPVTCRPGTGMRLHIVKTPSLTTCKTLGGHSWTPQYRICWDVPF